MCGANKNKLGIEGEYIIFSSQFFLIFKNDKMIHFKNDKHF